MTPTELLATLSQCGVSLEPHGGRLRYRAPAGALTPALKQALAEQKAAIIQILAAEVADASVSTLADDRKLIHVSYQRIFYDWNLADGTYTPEQLRKAKMVVKAWGPVQSYTLTGGERNGDESCLSLGAGE